MPVFLANDAGDLGFALYTLGGNVYEEYYVGLYDALTPTLPPAWPVDIVAAGNVGPKDNIWGDYSWTDRYYQNGLQWVATGHVKTKTDAVEPWFVRFGRYENN